HIELRGGVYETGQNRHDSPRDHDPPQPLPRAPALHEQCARYLEQDIAEVEDADTKPKDAIAEPEIGAHPQVGKRHIDAVDVVDEIDQKDKWEQPPGNTPPRSNA